MSLYPYTWTLAANVEMMHSSVKLRYTQILSLSDLPDQRRYFLCPKRVVHPLIISGPFSSDPAFAVQHSDPINIISHLVKFAQFWTKIYETNIFCSQLCLSATV